MARGLEGMPFTELSQADFLIFVANARVTSTAKVSENAIKIMEIVVNNPDRLHKSAFGQEKKVRPRLTKLQHVEIKG